MTSKKIFLFIILNIVVFCESAFVDTLTKCKINDVDCEKALLQRIIKDIAKTGIPEIDLPPIDPVQLKNITINVLDLLEVSLIDGYARGVKDCIINRFETNIEDERVYMEITCDILVRGKYKAFSSSPLVKSVLNGESVRGDGEGKVKIEKLNLKFDFFFYIQKRNGELYIKPKYTKTKYDFDVKGKMIFFADKIYVGEVESSRMVLRLLNENWKFLMGSFGKPFMDKTMSFLYVFLQKFFDGIPVTSYISDDLSSYARP